MIWIRAYHEIPLYEKILELLKGWGVEDLMCKSHGGVYQILQVEPWDELKLMEACERHIDDLIRLLDSVEWGFISISDYYPLDPYYIHYVLVKPRAKANTVLKEILFKSIRYYWDITTLAFVTSFVLKDKKVVKEQGEVAVLFGDKIREFIEKKVLKIV